MPDDETTPEREHEREAQRRERDERPPEQRRDDDEPSTEEALAEGVPTSQMNRPTG